MGSLIWAMDISDAIKSRLASYYSMIIVSRGVTKALRA